MAKSSRKKGKGRPSKFEQSIEKVKLLSRRGFTDEEIALVLGITQRTFDNWKSRNKEFFLSLKNWKLAADEDVERSLYERACGYNHPEIKPQWVESYVKNEETGKFVKVGRWEYAELVKHYPPDTTACIFWLKNRQKDRWRDRTEVDINGLDGLADRIRQSRGENSQTD